MPVAPIGVLDLSSITDRLIAVLNNCRDSSPLWNPNNLAVNPGPAFTINISGLSPEEVRTLGDCQVSFYLFHVAKNPYQNHLPPAGLPAPNRPPIQYQPLALDLYYLLSAYAKGNYAEEQQAMSVATRCLHDNPIVHLDVTFGAQVVREEFSVTLDAMSSDDMSRLWQAITVPPRLAAVYKVSVALISPEAPAAAFAPKPTHVSLTVDPSQLPFAASGQVVGTARTFQYRKPNGALSAVIDQSPATAAPNQTFFLYGAGLNQTTSNRVYLMQPNVADVDVTAWLAPLPVIQTESRFTLTLPNSVGAPAANTPPPGIYSLSVGDAGTLRSNSTPFSVAARVDVTVNPPLPADVAGTFTVSGLGFIPGQTQVLLDTVALKEAPLAAGTFVVDPLGTSIQFQRPNNLPPGFYALRIRVNQVESDPSWWVQVV